MTALLIALIAAASLLVGLATGYLYALRQVPSVLARMTETQLKALAKRTAERRQHEPSAPTSQ